MFELILHVAAPDEALVGRPRAWRWEELTAGPWAWHREVALEHLLPVLVGPPSAAVPVPDLGPRAGAVMVRREGWRVLLSGYPQVPCVQARLSDGEVELEDFLSTGPFTAWACEALEQPGARVIWWDRVVMWIELRLPTEAARQRWGFAALAPEHVTITAHVDYLGPLSSPPGGPTLGYEVTQSHAFELRPNQSFTAARVPGASGRSMLEVGHVLFARRGNLITARLIWDQRRATIIHPGDGWRGPLTGEQRLLPAWAGAQPNTGSRVLLDGVALVRFTTQLSPAAPPHAQPLLAGMLAQPWSGRAPMQLRLRIRTLGDEYVLSPRQAAVVDEVVVPLPEGELSLGRSRLCDVYLNHPSVARRHAIVSRCGDQVFFRDNGTANGCIHLTPEGGDRIPANDLIPLTPGTADQTTGDVFIIGSGALVSVEVVDEVEA